MQKILMRFIESHVQKLLETDVKRRILLGTYTLSAGHYDSHYKKSQKVRMLVAQDFADVFAKYDVIIGPIIANTCIENWWRNQKIS